MNLILFGLFFIKYCSASRECKREKDRINELSQQNRELQIERNELKEENEELKRKLEALQTTTTTTEISTTTTTKTIEPSDVFILVIPPYLDQSYLQSSDGSSQMAKINAPQNNYAQNAAHALVKGELHVFGGLSDAKKIAKLDGCSFNELPGRLIEERKEGHAAVSTENGRKALVCFGDSGNTRSSCEIFDGSATAPTFAAEWTHQNGALGFYKHQAATVGCEFGKHQKAETLSPIGKTALPDHPLKINRHSLVGLDNGVMLLLGGYDSGNYNFETGIWELKEEEWSRIGELSKPAYAGSAIFISRSVYYFEWNYWSIYRVDLDKNEELEAVNEIGTQSEAYYFPVLFQTDNDTCTEAMTTRIQSTAMRSSATSELSENFLNCLMIIIMTLLRF